jgi:hypothetical protein
MFLSPVSCWVGSNVRSKFFFFFKSTDWPEIFSLAQKKRKKKDLFDFKSFLKLPLKSPYLVFFRPYKKLVAKWFDCILPFKQQLTDCITSDANESEMWSIKSEAPSKGKVCRNLQQTEFELAFMRRFQR